MEMSAAVTNQEHLSAALQAFIAARERDSLPLHVNVVYEVRDRRGRLKQRVETHNLICTAGKNKLLDTGAGSKYLKDYGYICIGTGTNAAASGDTALQTENARALGTLSNPSATTWQNTVTFAAGTGTGTITESGLDYQNTASGAILARQVFTGVAKGAGDSLAVTWQIT